MSLLDSGVSSFEESYLGQLRALAGNRTLLVPATRAVIQNDAKRVVLVRRRDNGAWVLPGGFMELGESVRDSLRREVGEETGLAVGSATLVAIHSEPRFAFTNAYGGRHQLLNLIFRVDEWTGSLVRETDETLDARFFAVDDLPEITGYEREVLEDCEAFSGRVVLK